MAQSPIQPKKQHNRKSSVVWGWRRQGRGGWEKFEIKGGIGNIGGSCLHKIGGYDPSPNYVFCIRYKKGNKMKLFINTCKFL